MKVGDLVKYRHYHDKLKDMRGVVCKVVNNPYWKPERALVLWNHPRFHGDDMDWVDDLEVVSESQ